MRPSPGRGGPSSRSAGEPVAGGAGPLVAGQRLALCLAAGVAEFGRLPAQLVGTRAGLAHVLDQATAGLLGAGCPGRGIVGGDPEYQTGQQCTGHHPRRPRQAAAPATGPAWPPEATAVRHRPAAPRRPALPLLRASADR